MPGQGSEELSEVRQRLEKKRYFFLWDVGFQVEENRIKTLMRYSRVCGVNR